MPQNIEVGTVSLELQLDTKQIETGFDRVGQSAGKLSDEMRQKLGSALDEFLRSFSNAKWEGALSNMKNMFGSNQNLSINTDDATRKIDNLLEHLRNKLDGIQDMNITKSLVDGTDKADFSQLQEMLQNRINRMSFKPRIDESILISGVMRGRGIEEVRNDKKYQDTQKNAEQSFEGIKSKSSESASYIDGVFGSMSSKLGGKFTELGVSFGKILSPNVPLVVAGFIASGVEDRFSFTFGKLKKGWEQIWTTTGNLQVLEEINSKFEMLEARLHTLTGSLSKTAEMMNSINEAASGTKFTSLEMGAVASRSLEQGMKTDVESMKMLADWSTLTNTPMMKLQDTYAKIRSSQLNSVMLREMKTFGVSEAQLFAKGLDVNATRVAGNPEKNRKAVMEIVQDISKGASEEAAGTFEGYEKQLINSWQKAQNNIMRETSAYTKPLLDNLTKGIDNQGKLGTFDNIGKIAVSANRAAFDPLENLTKVFSGNEIAQGINSICEVLEHFFDVLGSAGNAIVPLVQVINELGAFDLITAGLKVLSTALVEVERMLNMVQYAFNGLAMASVAARGTVQLTGEELFGSFSPGHEQRIQKIKQETDKELQALIDKNNKITAANNSFEKEKNIWTPQSERKQTPQIGRSGKTEQELDDLSSHRKKPNESGEDKRARIAQIESEYTFIRTLQEQYQRLYSVQQNQFAVEEQLGARSLLMLERRTMAAYEYYNGIARAEEMTKQMQGPKYQETEEFQKAQKEIASALNKDLADSVKLYDEMGRYLNKTAQYADQFAVSITRGIDEASKFKIAEQAQNDYKNAIDRTIKTSDEFISTTSSMKAASETAGRVGVSPEYLASIKEMNAIAGQMTGLEKYDEKVKAIQQTLEASKDSPKMWAKNAEDYFEALNKKLEKTSELFTEVTNKLSGNTNKMFSGVESAMNVWENAISTGNVTEEMRENYSQRMIELKKYVEKNGTEADVSKLMQLESRGAKMGLAPAGGWRVDYNNTMRAGREENESVTRLRIQNEQLLKDRDILNNKLKVGTSEFEGAKERQMQALGIENEQTSRFINPDNVRSQLQQALEDGSLAASKTFERVWGSAIKTIGDNLSRAVSTAQTNIKDYLKGSEAQNAGYGKQNQKSEIYVTSAINLNVTGETDIAKVSQQVADNVGTNLANIIKQNLGTY